MSNGGEYRMLIDVCQMVEDIGCLLVYVQWWRTHDAYWCMSNGGGHRTLISVCQMVEDIGY